MFVEGPISNSEDTIQVNQEVHGIMRVFHKSLVTTLIAAAFVIVGLLISEPARGPVLSIGLFALSGAVTNWLAIHMLFEKVPGLYGSGVVPARFEDFKEGIHNLVMEQFFTRENAEKVLESAEMQESGFDLVSIVDEIDFSSAFDSLVRAVMESTLGKMLGMFGGKAALDSLREPFADRMKGAFTEIVQTPSVQESIRAKLTNASVVEELLQNVGTIVQNRLGELTPQIVKDIVQEMIRKHLGWLVVWGGVFGGGIGLITALVLP